MQTAAAIVERLDPVPDPWEIAKNLVRRGLPHLLFLDSAQKHAGRGRYSYVMADPAEWYSGRYCDAEFGDPFLQLSLRQMRTPVATVAGLPPFQGGLAGLFGYELSHCAESLPKLERFPDDLPDLAVGLYLWVLAWDHIADEAWLIVQPGGPPVNTVREWMRPCSNSYPENPPAKSDRLSGFTRLSANLSGNFDRDRFISAVRRAIDSIRAGECFQVNLAQTLACPATRSPPELYGRLRACNPAPFAAYFDTGEGVILSASPERFLKVAAGEVETRPIKGTRPRGTTPEADAAQVRDLASSAKDRAENVMIVDLLRNDLGKSCEFGSVTVPKVCEIETFETVHHMVSEVRGRVRADQSPLMLLRNCFPGGSVTGAPKVRAMQIISELEGRPRGAYCGSLGFVGLDGTMDTNILIRTITASRDGWWTFPVGGGIVADSDPEREYQETWDKAEGLLRSVE